MPEAAPATVQQAEAEYVPPESTESQFEDLPPDFWDEPADRAEAASRVPAKPASSPAPPAPAAAAKPPAPARPAETASAAAGTGLALVQELFPGKVLNIEKFSESEDGTGMGVESESYEYPEADEGSPEGSGEDA